MKTGTRIKIAAVVCAGLLISGVAFGAAAKKPAKSAPAHPKLSAAEMLVDCAECHQDATQKVVKEWNDSTHGLAMVKCYQCHGESKKIVLTPPLATCAACHAGQMNKCPQDKACWQCHLPHSFTAKK